MVVATKPRRAEETAVALDDGAMRPLTKGSHPAISDTFGIANFHCTNSSSGYGKREAHNNWSLPW